MTLAELRRFGGFEYKVVANGHVADQAHAVAVLRDVGGVFVDESPGAEVGDLFTFKVKLACFGGQHAGHELCELALAVAIHAGDAHDLPPAHGERNAVKTAVLGGFVVFHCLERQHGAAGMFLLFILKHGQLPADHQVGQIRRA